MEIEVMASGSTGNSYLISDGETRLIIEAGIPVRAMQRGCGYSLTSCAGCLISHSHGDHAGHAKELLKKGVDIYASAGTISAVGLTGHRVHAVRGGEQFMVGSMVCMGFNVDHDAPEPLGFILQSIITHEKLLYFTDTPRLQYRFRGVTHMMCECNYDRETLMAAVECGVARLCDSHMGLDTLLTILACNDLSSLKKIYLIHLSNRHANEQRLKRAVQAATGVEVITC